MQLDIKSQICSTLRQTGKISTIGVHLSDLEIMICAYLSRVENPAESDMLNIIRAIPNYTRRVLFRLLDDYNRLFHNLTTSPIIYGEDRIKQIYQKQLVSFDINKYDKNTFNKNPASIYDNKGILRQLILSNPDDDINPTDYLTDGVIPQQVRNTSKYRAYSKANMEQLKNSIYTKSVILGKAMIELAKANLNNLEQHPNSVTAHNQMIRALKTSIANHRRENETIDNISM